MLGIHRSYGKAASQYFSKGLSREGEYYLGENIESYWIGKLSERLGLKNQKVLKEDFEAFIKGKNSKTGQPLRVRKNKDARSGYDFTFSAPKSVSILLSLTKNPDILKAHQEAYRAVLKEIEAEVKTQANTLEERIYEHTGEFIVAPFDHFQSRPTPYKVGKKVIYVCDPQTHTHCFVMPFTYSHKKQRYQAIELGIVHRQAKYFEASYHAHLAHNLEVLGFQTRRTSDRFELINITREQIEKFSTRTKIIKQVAHTKGITDKAEIAKLATITRHSKGKALNEKEQYEHWKSRLSEDEFKTLFKLQNLPKKTQVKISAKDAIERSLAHHCERNSAFKEKDVLAYAIKISYGDLLPKDVQQALREREDVIKAELDVVPYITTLRMLKEERDLVIAAANGKGKYVAFHPTYQPKQSFLNEQQTKAISQVLHSRDFITGIRGAAGVGKSTIISELVKAHMEKGKQLYCLAPSSQAVSVLKEKGYQADTIAGFLKKEQFHQLYGQTILVDEGGMVGTKQFNELIAVGQKHNMRYLVSGDTAQHTPPAQYGDSMRHLIEKAQINTAHVSTIVRQKNKALKSVVGSLSKGKTLEGFQKLEKMGLVKEEQDRDKRLEKIADAYVQAVIDKKTALVVSPTHAENDLINATIRKKLKQKKLITGKERTVTSLRSMSFTKDQKKDQQNYEEKQIIRFLNNAKGNYRAGVAYEVIEDKKSGILKIQHPQTGQRLPLPLEHNNLFDVFKSKDMQLAKGDVIRATANIKTIEGTKINNGNSYIVSGFTRSGDIKLDNKKTLKKDTGHIRYQMSDTSHASQGKDADKVIVSVSDLSFSAASREQFYVSVSRGKEQATIYTNNREELKKSIKKTEQRVSAQDIADKHRERFLQRQQRKRYHELNTVKHPEKVKEIHKISNEHQPALRLNRE